MLHRKNIAAAMKEKQVLEHFDELLYLYIPYM